MRTKKRTSEPHGMERGERGGGDAGPPGHGHSLLTEANHPELSSSLPPSQAFMALSPEGGGAKEKMPTFPTSTPLLLGNTLGKEG